MIIILSFTLLDKEEIAAQACDSFTAILYYMGDLPTNKKSRLGNEFTDAIFESALRHVSPDTFA